LSSVSPAHNAQFVGSYRSVNFVRSDLFKIGALLNEYQITAEADGALLLHYPSSHVSTRWAEVQPLLFQRITPTEDTESALAAFQVDQTGAITHLFVGTGNTLTRLAWYETTTTHLVLVCGLLLTFLSGCLVGPIGGLLRRIRRRPVLASRTNRLSGWLAGIYSGLALVFLIGLVVSLLAIDSNEFNFGIPASVKALLIIPLLLIPMTLGLLVFAGVAWKRGDWSLAGRLHYSLVTLAALLLIPFLLYWNLVAWPT